MRKAIPDSRLEEFAQLCVDGLTIKELAAHFACGRDAVERVKRELGLTRKLAEPGTHGANLYSSGRCKCRVCTAAHRDRMNRRNVERAAAPKDPNDPRHGRPTFYANHGCRCEKCSAAWAMKCRAYYRRKTGQEAA